MTKVQKLGTKIFKGAAFIGKPDKIMFKDFDVGKSHYLTLVLTNVSNAFNSFNVLPLPQKIRVTNKLKSELLLSFIQSERSHISRHNNVDKIQIFTSAKLRYQFLIFNFSRDRSNKFPYRLYIKESNYSM